MVKASFDLVGSPDKHAAAIDIKPFQRSLSKVIFDVPSKGMHYYTSDIRLPSIGEFIAVLSVNGKPCMDQNAQLATLNVSDCNDGFSRDGLNCIEKRGVPATACDSSTVWVDGKKSSAPSMVSGQNISVKGVSGSCQFQVVPLNLAKNASLNQDLAITLPGSYQVRILQCAQSRECNMQTATRRRTKGCAEKCAKMGR